MNYTDAGRGKFNQLGGVFVNGKPLPNSVRQKIIEMAECGIRPCDISRQLKVSHGCISKLLSKYNDTGSFEPGRAQRKTSRDVSSEVKNKIEEYRRITPRIFSWEVSEKLLADGLCSKETLPGFYEISKLLSKPMPDGRAVMYGQIDLETRGNGWYFEDGHLQNQTNVERETDSLFTESFEEDYSGKAISVTASKSPQMRHYYRRNRTKFMPQQIREMEAAFCKTQYPDVLMREEMGKRLDITESRIQIWFSNRRSKEKRLRNSSKHFSQESQIISRILYPQDHQFVTSTLKDLHAIEPATGTHCSKSMDLYKGCTCVPVNRS